jgi:hypothetical protein
MTMLPDSDCERAVIESAAEPEHKDSHPHAPAPGTCDELVAPFWSTVTKPSSRRIGKTAGPAHIAQLTSAAFHMQQTKSLLHIHSDERRYWAYIDGVAFIHYQVYLDACALAISRDTASIG